MKNYETYVMRNAAHYVLRLYSHVHLYVCTCIHGDLKLEETKRRYPRGEIAADVVINAFKKKVVTLDVNNVG